MAQTTAPASPTAPPLDAVRHRAEIVVHDRVLQEVSSLLFCQFLKDAGPPSKGDPGPKAALIAGTDVLRPDVVATLRELHAPIVRFPGGYLAEHVTSFDYRGWLPASLETRWNRRWDLPPIDPSLRRAFGLIEFYGLCDTLGAQPLVVVPTKLALLELWSDEQAAEFAAGRVALDLPPQCVAVLEVPLADTPAQATDEAPAAETDSEDR